MLRNLYKEVIIMKSKQIKETWRRGARGDFLDMVENPRGTKKPVYIYQGMKPGFSARYEDSFRELAESNRNAEALARKLARAGHRRVTFRD